jgi:hypothetical protein
MYVYICKVHVHICNVRVHVRLYMHACVYGIGCVVEKECNQTAHSVAVFIACCVVL